MNYAPGRLASILKMRINHASVKPADCEMPPSET